MINNKVLGTSIITISLILIILLGIVKINVDNQEAFLCEEVHKDPTVNIEQCPAHNSNNSWLFLIAFGVLFFSLGFGIYLVFADNHQLTQQTSPIKESENKRDYKNVDLDSLDEEEKRLYNIIKDKDGSAYQSDLVKETDFSKVKITRVLDKLEHKGIIERKRRGMTNIVVLK